MYISQYQGSAEEWDAFVRSQPDFTHFHLYGWRTVMERAFGHHCFYLESRDADGQLDAVLPLVRVKSLLFGDFLVSMPFVNYGGPLGSREGIVDLVDHAAEWAREHGVQLLELRSRKPLELDLDVSHRKVTVLLDLPPVDPDLLWRQFPTELRTKIRRPMKEGVEVRFGLDQLEPFYRVFAENMRDLGTPVQSRRFFQVIAEVFPDVWFGCAYLNGRPIASGCGFQWGNEFEITWGSALKAFNKLRPNGLLYWRLMERCINRGLAVFNFGRCTPGSGPHAFKQQWGARDVPLWWYHTDGARAATPSPADQAFSWGPMIWRRLPLAIANSIGPRVVRYVP